MGRPGMLELLIILAIIVIFFGAKKLPEIARSLAKSIKEFKKAGKEINDDAEQQDKEKK